MDWRKLSTDLFDDFGSFWSFFDVVLGSWIVTFFYCLCYSWSNSFCLLVKTTLFGFCTCLLSSNTSFLSASVLNLLWNSFMTFTKSSHLQTMILTLLFSTDDFVTNYGLIENWSLPPHLLMNLLSVVRSSRSCSWWDVPLKSWKYMTLPCKSNMLVNRFFLDFLYICWPS